MQQDELINATKQELQTLRAKRFMGGSALMARIPEDYKERPELLAVDLAWVVAEALCAAALAGVELDVDAAVEAGKVFYGREGYPVLKQDETTAD